MGCGDSRERTPADKPLADLGHSRRGKDGKRKGGKGRSKQPPARQSSGTRAAPDRERQPSVASSDGRPTRNPAEAAAVVENPLTPSARQPPRPPAGGATLEADEAQRRADIRVAELRQWGMIEHDFARERPVPHGDESHVTSVGIPGSSFTVDFGGDDDDDFDDRPRRSTMNQREYKDASRMRGMTAAKAAKSSNVKQSEVPRLSEEGVRRHQTEDDCWVILRGEVYDVTELLDEHPGGAYAIFQHAGTDATKAFEAAHRAGVRPWEDLAKYRLGKVDYSGGKLSAVVPDNCE